MKLYIVPHSHIDVEWYWTAQDVQDMMPQLFYNTTLPVLQRDEKMRFAQDQAVIWDMMLRGAEEGQRQLIIEKVKQGALEPVGGTYVQPEVQEPCGESYIRQIQIGQKWMEENLGRRAVCAWHTDVFGQNSQLPQILRQAGFESFAFMRDISQKDDPEHFPTEFLLEGPDGSRILTHWFRISYVLCESADPGHRLVVATIGGVKPEKEELQYVFRQMLEEDSLQHKTGLAMLPWGGDVYGLTLHCEEIRAELIRAAEKVGLQLCREDIVIATPSEFFRELAKKQELLEVKRCDLNPPQYRQDLRGTYISRIKLKQKNRQAEQALLSWQSLCACAGVDAKDARELWKPVLFGQFHDTIGGSCIDEVYVNAMEGDDAVLADVAARTCAILGGGEEGMLLNVYNPTQFARQELVTVKAETDCRVRTAQGEELYSHYDSQKKILSILVPQIGPFETITLYAEKVQRECTVKPAERLENEFYCLHLDPVSGNPDSIWDKQENRELLDGQGNVIVALAEQNPDMEGEIRLTGEEFTDAQIPATRITVEQTEQEIRAVVEKTFLGFGLKKTIVLPKGKKTVEFYTDILDYPGKDLIINAKFPFRMEAPCSLYESAFAVEEGREGLYCAQKWAGLRDGKFTAAILNRGTCAYWAQENALSLSLLRAHGHFAEYAEYGAERGLARFADGRSHTELAAERGDHHVAYALVSGSGGTEKWSALALCYNTPLEAAWSSAPAAFSAPIRAVEGPFIVTCLEPTDRGGILVRGYNASAQEARCTICLARQDAKAQFVDLLDKPLADVCVNGGKIQFHTRPFEIVTMQIQ